MSLNKDIRQAVSVSEPSDEGLVPSDDGSGGVPVDGTDSVRDTTLPLARRPRCVKGGRGA